METGGKMCKNQRAYFCLGLVFLLSCLPLVTSWAEGMNSGDPISPLQAHSLSTMSSETLPTGPWASFDSAWTSLKHELTQWSEDSQRLYTLLEELQIEAEGLRSSLMLSTEQFMNSETARLEERQATELILAADRHRADEADMRAYKAGIRADQAARSSRLWRSVALAAVGIGTLGWITAWAGLR
jgi:hypothetical protein